MIIGRRDRAGRAVEQKKESKKKARGHVHRARGLVERRRVVDAVAPRKAAAARLAEQGCTEFEIMAITGHRTSKEVTRYTRAESALKRMTAERK